MQLIDRSGLETAFTEIEPPSGAAPKEQARVRVLFVTSRLSSHWAVELW